MWCDANATSRTGQQPATSYYCRLGQCWFHTATSLPSCLIWTWIHVSSNLCQVLFQCQVVFFFIWSLLLFFFFFWNFIWSLLLIHLQPPHTQNTISHSRNTCHRQRFLTLAGRGRARIIQGYVLNDFCSSFSVFMSPYIHIYTMYGSVFTHSTHDNSRRPCKEYLIVIVNSYVLSSFFVKKKNN